MCKVIEDFKISLIEDGKSPKTIESYIGDASAFVIFLEENGVDFNRKMITVSGHQRERACSEMGILEIPYVENAYPDFDEKTGTSKEDMILEDFISTNLMQRGVGNVNAQKMCRCINELERIYGIQNGGNRGNQYTKEMPDSNNFNVAKTQKDLAEQFGITQQQYLNYKKLSNLIPELQSLVEHDSLKATTA